MTSPAKYKTLEKIVSSDRFRQSHQMMHVFVAGPYVDFSRPYPSDPYTSHSAKLRHFLKYKIESELHHTVFAGEHEEVMKAAGIQFDEFQNHHSNEISLADRHTEAVILIPDSPGSFAELGAWVTQEDICRKLLIFAEKQFKDSKNYIVGGPFRHAKEWHKAEIQFIDYTDLDECWNHASQFLRLAHAKYSAKKHDFR